MAKEKLAASKLPKAALRKMSAAQRSYIDEFSFFKRDSGHIEGWYAGELLAVWNGKRWEEPKKVPNPKARKSKKTNPIGGARASYAKTHWGDMGNGEVSQGEALDISKEETLVTLGVLREIVYETVKGLEDSPAEYEHKFSKRNPPILAYGQKSGKLVIISPRHGGYFVSWRGIVG